jgi:hypothetical protein
MLIAYSAREKRVAIMQKRREKDRLTALKVIRDIIVLLLDEFITQIEIIYFNKILIITLMF